MSSPKPRHKDTQAVAAAAPAARAALLLQIDAALRPLADSVQAVPMRAYMLDQFAFLGIRATPRRQAMRGLPPRVRHQMTQVVDSYRARFKLATTKGSTGRLESVF